MKLVRYTTSGRVEVVEASEPRLPAGGIVVQALACGLCSGELMSWYMEAKAPHVLGHEVAGRVVESDSELFPVGALVVPHHHAACGECAECRSGREVACPPWRANALSPGGMAERFAVSAVGLADCHRCDDVDAIDAALAEPVACVVKSVERAGGEGSCAVVGLGSLGIAHLLLRPGSVGYDTNPTRREWALRLGLDARRPEEAEPARTWFVCPGSAEAMGFAMSHLLHDATVVLFAPMPPGEATPVDLHSSYFRDVRLVASYSCGPSHMARAIESIRAGTVRARHLVSTFVTMDGLPGAYHEMSAGGILKAMVVTS
ncbi:MAG: alcohol dehydrogenase catalytic domain-containing protein [Fimbriimonadaceae bacterium]